MSELKRVKYVTITPEILFDMIQSDVKILRMQLEVKTEDGRIVIPERLEEVTVTGLPKDAKLCGAAYDFVSDCFILRIESSEFPKVQHCDGAPRLYLECKSKVVETAKRGREFI